MLALLKAFRQVKREAPRFPCFTLVELYDGGAFLEEGFLKDLSEFGARVAFNSAPSLPDSFEVRIPSENIRSRAQVRWRRGESFGVEFSEPIRIRNRSGSPLDECRLAIE